MYQSSSSMAVDRGIDARWHAVVLNDMHCAGAKQLAAKGAQVVEADATSAESLRMAFGGAYGVWGMTPVVAVAANGEQSPYEQEIMLGAGLRSTHSLHTGS